MDDQGTEMVSFQLVAAAGEARSLAFEATATKLTTRVTRFYQTA